MGLLGCVFYPERGMIPTVSTYERSGGRKINEVAFDYRQSCACSKHFGKRPSVQMETAWLEDCPTPSLSAWPAAALLPSAHDRPS